VFLCQKRLRLSLKVDECEPLVPGRIKFIRAGGIQSLVRRRRLSL
jgi:hypothetical protein